MIRRPPRSTLSSSSAASDVYKRQVSTQSTGDLTQIMAVWDLMRSQALLFLLAPLLVAQPITMGHARFTVLSPSLLRMEWTAASTFEDRPSLVFSTRPSAPGATSNHSISPDGTLHLDTAMLSLRFSPTCTRGFTPDCLRVSTPFVSWTPPSSGISLIGAGNLNGSLQTMDCYLGPEECKDCLLYTSPSPRDS
eukprot:TRINITY_DN63407_c0_g1_i1.p1 TRINITY_DN63407_c0_g1~~TRINITY_DN63407_c0_g1_i1.p1  ORF type:complete len:193 (+),score=42.62 TRINITY_DN63407_c0_g1_i1:49-627(+)